MSDKKLCKIIEKKEIEEKKEFEKYIELVKNGNYICKKCGRVAVNKGNLCKPEKIEV
jgi:rubrerythrin